MPPRRRSHLRHCSNAATSWTRFFLKDRYSSPFQTSAIDYVGDLAGKRTISVQTRAGAIRVLSRKDLIAMKRASGRPQDLADADALEKL
jgi:hypothetical protein